MSRNQKIVIIGAGPAGCAAAVQCKRLGCSPLILERTGEVGGLVKNAFSIENYPGLEPTEGPTFVGLLEKHVASFDVEVERGRVDRILRSDSGLVVKGDFGELVCRSVIVAVGTRSNLLDIPGAVVATGKGLYYEVFDFAGEANHAVVIGGGEAALDYSLTLARKSAEVTILVRGKSLRASGRLVELAQKSSLINIEFETAPLSIARKNSGVGLEIETPSGRTHLDADAVFAAIGRYPATTDLLKGLDVDLSGALSTRIPGLFIVGDARTGGLGQVGMAVGDGLAAAQAAVQFVG